MISLDLASRLRSLIADTVNPIDLVRPTPSDLPEFDQGSRFRALIQNPLGNGNFRAQVGGQNVTLNLPNPAKAGDVLELVVTRNEQGTIYAKTSPPSEGATSASRPQLSQTGQFISQLLTGRYSSAEGTALAAGKPIINTPPNNPAELAGALRQTLSQSGLFFESHQAQWAQGKLPLQALLQEPQAQEGLKQLAARISPEMLPKLPPEVAAQLRPLIAERDLRQATLNDKDTMKAHAPAEVADSADEGLTQAAAKPANEAPATSGARAGNALNVPERLMPLVHQQLDALATQQAIVQIQAWPGQNVQWMLEHADEGNGQSSQEDKGDMWRSSLRLSLPGMGDVAAELVLTSAGISIGLQAAQANSAGYMQSQIASLQSALEGAGLSVNTLSVSQAAEVVDG